MAEEAAKTKLIQISLSVNKAGLKVQLKTSPEIEEYFKQQHLGSGESLLPGTGRWCAPESFPALKYYRLAPTVERALVTSEPSKCYVLNNIDGDLLSPDGHKVNLSMLRLVGISEGVSFTARDTVVSPVLLQQLEKKLMEATKLFYYDTFKPHGLKLTMSMETW